MNEVVFLGIFDKIANWILGGITKALTWLFTNVISPVWSIVWDNFLHYIVDFIREILALLLYKLYAMLLSIVYAVEQMVYSFSGVKSVNIEKESGNILTLLMNRPAVNNAFWYITSLALVLCFVFTIVAVMRSTFDLNFDSRKSIGRVLTQFFRAAVSFLIMPALCFGLIQLTTVCMNAMYQATSVSGTSTYITDNLYMLTVKGAITEQKPEAFVQLGKKLNDSPMFWYTFSDVKNYLSGLGVKFNARDVDLFVGYIGCILLMFNLLSLAGVFIRRVMELIVLYIASPFFVATIPLDDGERFNKWRTTFIGRLCMGAGMVIAINVMMLVISLVIGADTSTSVSFVEIRDPNKDILGYSSDVAFDILVKLIFMIGAILSVRSIGVAITGIIDQNAANVMNESLQMRDKAFGMVKNGIGKAKEMYSGAKGLMDKKKALSTMRAGYASGFKGQAATKQELNFYQKLQSKKLSNAAGAAKANRGEAKAAFKKASKQANNAMKQFRELKTNDERKAFMNSFNQRGGMAALEVNEKKLDKGVQANSGETRAGLNIDKNIASVKANRNKFEKGSENWNKYNNKLQELKGLRDKFDSTGSHAERKALMDANKAAFSPNAAKSKGEKKAIENLNKKAENAKRVRDSLQKGTKAWDEADKKYNSLLEKSAVIEELGSNAEREKFISENKEATESIGFKDRQGGKASGLAGIEKGISRIFGGGGVTGGLRDIGNSIAGIRLGKDKGHQSAMENLDKKIARTSALRDSFKKDSSEWNKYNDKLEKLNEDKLRFSTSDTDERDKLIKESSSFGHISQMSEDEKQAIENLDANIKRATEDRDRHKVGSDKWNAANNRLNNLTGLRASFMDTDTHEERASMISSSKGAFENKQSDDLRELRGKYNAWKMQEESAKDDNAREHAHKMAKSYAEFIEGYNNASGSSGRAALLENLSEFERMSAMPSGPAFTAKEASGFGKISLSGNEKYISAFMNAPTHAERAKILSDYNTYMETHNGERPPAYEMTSRSENEYSAYMRDTAQQLMQTVNSGELTEEQVVIMRRAAEFYRTAANEFDAASTHDRREQIVEALDDYVGNMSVQEREVTGISGIKHVEYTTAETTFMQGLDSAQRREFATCTTHSQRLTFMADTYRNSPDFVKFDETETAFYQNHFAAEGNDGYRNTDVYGTAFLGARSHEERMNIIQQYADYISTADASHSPGNWGTTVSAGLGSAVASSVSSYTDTQSFAAGLDFFESAQFGSITDQREQQRYMTNYYISSPAFVSMSEEESRFFESRLNIPDEQGYRNTPIYRTAFAAAATHEQRQQVMNDYNDYILFSESEHSPGNWNSSDRMYYGTNEEAVVTRERSDRLNTILSERTQSSDTSNANSESGTASGSAPVTDRERFVRSRSGAGSAPPSAGNAAGTSNRNNT